MLQENSLGYGALVSEPTIYSYVVNNPLALTDPTGYEPWGTTTNSDGNTVHTQYTDSGNGTTVSNSYTADRSIYSNGYSSSHSKGDGVSPSELAGLANQGVGVVSRFNGETGSWRETNFALQYQGATQNTEAAGAIRWAIYNAVEYTSIGDWTATRVFNFWERVRDPSQRLQAPSVLDTIALIAAMRGVGPIGSKTAATSIGYHATSPEAAEAIMAGGFRVGTKPGRLGSGGVYVNSTPEGAIAEFAVQNPGIKPRVLTVQYSAGENASAGVAPRNYVTEHPLNVDSISAPSVRAPGTINTNVLNGTAKPTGIAQ